MNMPNEYKVLTLYLTRDKKSFIKDNYESVRDQRGVTQDIFVISSEPLDIDRNIAIPVPKSLPIPIRVSFSLNMVLKQLRENIRNYSHIFKVDGDVRLPYDYLVNLARKKTPIAGIGAALLISVPFFTKLLGEYPISYCDDGYISALSISIGYWPPQYDGRGKLKLPPITYFSDREYQYGIEYYKWGMPSTLLLVISTLKILKGKHLKEFEKRDLRAPLFNVAGYLSGMIKGERYCWWRKYRYYRTYHFIKKLVFLIERLFWRKSSEKINGGDEYNIDN
ncbi:hypothetical protein DRO35_02905 [Candidatus Bathyarchaeota archaeon]|nr:MAG: hypothetical protein DRO35_02905 [Candidatus Bathyarchaeota archaeon]